MPRAINFGGNRFLRTVVTLLSGSDHESIKTDAKYLNPPLIPSSGPKPFPSPSHATEQERARLMGLKARAPPARPQAQTQTQAEAQAQAQVQVQAQVPPHVPSHSPAIPKLPQQHAVPATSPPLAQQTAPSTPSTEQAEEQIRRMARQPQASPEPSASAAPAVPQVSPSPRVGVTQQQQSTPATNGTIVANGFHARPMSLANGLSGEDAATVRVSSAIRPKVHTPGLQHQGTLGTAINGYGNAHTTNSGAFIGHQAPNQAHGVMHPGHAHGLNPQQYAALRNVFGAQQQQQQQQFQHQQQQQQQLQPGRSQMPMQMPMNGVSGNGNINLQMGPGNLNLKLPQSRPQMRMNGTMGGDVNGVNVSGSPVPMHASPPRPNVACSPVPQARAPSTNGHLMAPNHGRASPANGHLLGHGPPHGHPAAHSVAPHLQSSLGPLPLHTAGTPARPAPQFMHQQMVGAAGQGHEYS